MSNPKILTIRAKAFTGEGVRSHRVKVENGFVAVWDSVAGHYTVCHALSTRAKVRILAEAAEATE